MLINDAQLTEFKDLLGDAADAIIADYFSNAAHYCTTIAEGIAAADHSGIREAAHPLKSASAQLGFTRVSEIAMALEEAAIDQLPIDSIAAQLPALTSALQETQALL